MAAQRPQLICRIAFQDDPTLAFWTLNDTIHSVLNTTTVLYSAFAPAPIYSDVTAYLDGDAPMTIKRGRNYELERVEAGRVTLTLINKDGRFTPGNTGSPYYPFVKPRRRINIQATYLGSQYDLFSGFVETWPPDDQGLDSRVTITAVDAFKPLAIKKVSGTFASDNSGDAMQTILDLIGWPTDDRDMNQGVAIVPSVTLTNKSVLQHFQDINNAEDGQIYMERNGQFIFRYRNWRLTIMPGSVFTMSDAPNYSTIWPYEAVQITYDDQLIYNEVIVTRVGGTPQIVSDTDSQAEFFTQTLEQSNVLMSTDNEALSKANYLLNQYKQPDIRIRQLTINGDFHYYLYIIALSADIGWRMTVVRTPPGSATITKDVYIEAVEHRITRQAWRTNWQLSPAPDTAGWMLGDSTYSLLGVSTYLVY
jgi:hypothetical protein